MFGTSHFHSIHTMSRLLGLAIGLLGLTASVACADLAAIDPGTAEAVVQNIDSLSGEVTIEFSDGTTSTFNLDDIDLDGLVGLIGTGSLQAGDEIEVQRDSSNRVRSVTPHMARVEGTVVRSDSRTLTLEAEGGAELILSLTAQTQIELADGNRTAVSELTPGTSVRVKYNAETDEALVISHEAARQEGERHRVEGIIRAVHPGEHSIVIEDINSVERRIVINSRTEIDVKGPARFSRLEVGMAVRIGFGDDGSTVREVRTRPDVDRPTGHVVRDDSQERRDRFGIITAIDRDAQTITMQGEDGGRETFSVHSDTEVLIKDRARFSDLEVGMIVKINFDTNDMSLAYVHVRVEDDGHGHSDGDEVRGVISDINRDRRTITVKVDFEGATTYRLGTDTHVEIRGRADFADLKVGMLVAIAFDRETLVLSRLQVKVEDGTTVYDERHLDEADGPGELRGVITAIHRDARSITVRNLDGVERTFKAFDDTAVLLREEASFDDLEPGMLVKVIFDIDTMALHVVHVNDDGDSADLLHSDGHEDESADGDLTASHR